MNKGEGKIAQIAEHFKVNKATVSKALNGATDVGKDLREQICAYAESIGYVSRRQSRKIGTLGILWCKEEDEESAFVRAAGAFEEVALGANYAVETHKLERGTDLNAFCEEHHLAGALLPNMKSGSLLYSQLKVSRFPMVLLDSDADFENPLISSVKSNDLRAVSSAVNYLVGLGHKLIAFLGGSRDSLVAAERYAGYILGLARNGIPTVTISPTSATLPKNRAKRRRNISRGTTSISRRSSARRTAWRSAFCGRWRERRGNTPPRTFPSSALTI